MLNIDNVDGSGLIKYLPDLVCNIIVMHSMDMVQVLAFPIMSYRAQPSANGCTLS